MSKYPEHIAYAGGKFIIEYAVTTNGDMPAREFFLSLEEQDKRKLIVLFRYIGDLGKVTNPELFKKVENTVFFEFKRFQIRMICFFESDKKVILTHGFYKQRDRILHKEIDRAARIKMEHEARKGKR